MAALMARALVLKNGETAAHREKGRGHSKKGDSEQSYEKSEARSRGRMQPSEGGRSV